MDAMEAILKRRSIRKFKSDDIPHELIVKILEAGIAAPSAKNEQPWKFIVITNEDKQAMLNAMRAGIDNEKAKKGLFGKFDLDPRMFHGAEYTLGIMAEAPVTIFIYNTDMDYHSENPDFLQRLRDCISVQSVSAAIENMLLAATALGIGSLWICDIVFAYRELCEWLGEGEQLIAAISFGYTDECPDARPRKSIEEVTIWR